MSTAEILLIVILVPVTALNIYYFTIGRKKKQEAIRRYKQALAELESKTIAEMEKNHLQFEEKQSFLNDAGQGVQLSFSRKDQQMAVTLKDAFHLVPFSQMEPCSVHYDEADGKYANIRVEIKTPDAVIPIVFGTRAWRPRSIMGKMILEETTECCNLVNRQRGLAASGTPEKAETPGVNTRAPEVSG